MRGTIVLATYNEADSIRPVLAEIEEAVRVLERSKVELDVLLVDDSSPDGTAAIAQEQAALLDLRLEVLSGTKSGLGAALLRGFAHLNRGDTRDFFITMDADGQHDARQIPDLVRAFLSRGSGITIGSRWTRGGTSPGTPPHRMLLSRAGNFLARRVTGIRTVKDATTSFRVIRPQVTAAFRPDDLQVEGYGFFSAFVAVSQAHGFAIDEVPICFRPRYSGVSKLTLRDIVRFFTNLFKVRKQVHRITQAHRLDQTEWAERAPGFAAQAAAPGGTFGAAGELHSLAKATNFFGWIVDEMGTAIGDDVLEVGAGIGTVTRLLAQRHPHSRLLAIEPDPELFEELRTNTASLPAVSATAESSAEVHRSRGAGAFDTLVYVNVLEHIREQGAELRRAYELLRPGGALCVFVPALPRLYGSLDRKSGHYRRYWRGPLRDVVARAGFDVTSVRYMDVASVLPYWLTVRRQQVGAVGDRSTQLFDRVLVPISKAAQRVVPNPPIGKNLILVARKPAVAPR